MSDHIFVTIIKNQGLVSNYRLDVKPPQQPLLELDVPEKKAAETEKPVTIEEKLDFFSVARDLVSVLETYRKFIRIALDVSPFLSFGFLQKMETFAKRRGTLRTDLSDDKHDIYQLSVYTYNEFSSVHQEIQSASGGVRHLPEIMIIGLVSSYDAFLTKLLKVVFNLHEEIILTSEKQIKFSDLSKYKTIDEAKNNLIEREIESVIRDSHHAQIEWLEEKFEFPLRDGLKIWPKFIEICERRNLFTHTGGKVSGQYLSNCKKHNVDVSDLKIGDQLTVSTAYFSDAVNVFYELSIKLVHVFWRRFNKEDRERADKELSNLGYDLVFKEAYSLAEALLRFGTKTIKTHSSDHVRRIMVVNHANAIRLQDRKEEALAILNQEDWSAVGDEFKICVSALRDEVENVLMLMEKIGKNSSPSAEAYRTWPAFKNLRSNEKFLAQFQKVFDEPLIVSERES